MDDFQTNDVDELTGLKSLTYFQNNGREWIRNKLENGNRVTVFYINICGFRSYNRMYGFQTGNVLLRRLANVLNIESQRYLRSQTNTMYQGIFFMQKSQRVQWSGILKS